MTTFRSRTLGPDDVIHVATDISEPDAVGIEIETTNRQFVFGVTKMRDGRCTIGVNASGEAAPGFEMEINDFRIMLDRCLSDLEDWDGRLRAPGGPWA